MQNRPAHCTEYKDADYDADPEHQHMQVVKLLAEWRDALGHIELVGGAGRGGK